MLGKHKHASIFLLDYALNKYLVTHLVNNEKIVPNAFLFKTDETSKYDKPLVRCFLCLSDCCYYQLMKNKDFSTAI